MGKDLFKEWADELSQITSDDLRAGEEEVMAETRVRFDELVGKMKKAEESMQPVLAAFKDRVLVLKSRLNAQAIANLQGTSVEINDDVTELIAIMQASIDEADEYLAAERG